MFIKTKIMQNIKQVTFLGKQAQHEKKICPSIVHVDHVEAVMTLKRSDTPSESGL